MKDHLFAVFVTLLILFGLGYTLFIAVNNPRCLLAEDVGLCDAMTRETSE